MQKYWEFTQKNVFSELLALLGRMTQENLNQQGLAQKELVLFMQR